MDKKVNNKVWISIIIGVGMIILIISSFKDLLHKAQLNTDISTIKPDIGDISGSIYQNDFMGWQIHLPNNDTNLIIKSGNISDSDLSYRLFEILSNPDSSLIMSAVLDRKSAYPKIKNSSDYYDLFEKEFNDLIKGTQTNITMNREAITIDNEEFEKLKIQMYKDQKILEQMVVLFRFMDDFIFTITIRDNEYMSDREILEIVESSSFDGGNSVPNTQ